MENSNNFYQLIAQLQQSIDWINQVLKGGESDSVVIDGVIKPSVTKGIKDNFAEIQAMVVGRLAFETHSALLASGTPSSGVVLAEIWRDADRDKNGLYGWTGTTWEKSPYDSTEQFVLALDATNQNVEMGYRDAVTQVGRNGLSGGVDHSIDVVLKGGLSSEDKIVGAITDDFGNMLEGFNQNGEKLFPIAVRFLKSLLMSNTELIDGTFNYANAVMDENDNVAFGIETETGKTLAAWLKVFSTLEVGSSVIESGEFNYDFAVADENGHVAFGFLNGQIVFPNQQQVTAHKSVRDNANRVALEQFKTWLNPYPVQNVFDYNHLVVYGQSLSTGMEGWPRLSKTPLYGNLMLGDSVRPKSISGASFVPLGDKVEFKPLVSCVQNSGSGVLISDQDVANLRPGDGASGESPTEGWTNMAKWLHNRHFGVLNDKRTFIGTNNGVPGRTIEQLSKGSSPELYARFTQCIEQVKGLATAENKTYGVTGICWMQGEYNYTSNHGGDASRSGYLAKLKKLRLDMLADIQRVTLQPQEPAFFTYQVGAAYSRDDNELSIGMAQWDFSRDVANAYLVAPVYPYSDKGGHLDANGYRWYGNMIAKVYHKVVTLGQDWRPLSPQKIEIKERVITIDFHVPEPPLQFAKPFVVSSQTDFEDKGFKVTDRNGVVPIRLVEIVGATIIEITLERDIDAASGKLWYADHSIHRGNGNIMDSDRAVAHDIYEYNADDGHYPSANHPDLNNKPYPLNNWLIAFCLPVNWSE